MIHEMDEVLTDLKNGKYMRTQVTQTMEGDEVVAKAVTKMNDMRNMG